jgi:zinc transport system substrate-binding protein
MLIYVGGESDEWIDQVLKNLGDKAPSTLKLIDFVCSLEHDHDHTEDEHEHSAYDEHVWLSLRNAEALVKVISDELSRKLPDLADKLNGNSEAYINSIKELDAELEAALLSAPIKTLIFADRFPFGYLVKDYSLEYHAAFSGCSADSEASFETVAELAKKLDELSLPYVLVLESSDKKLAETVIASTANKSAEILVIDSMQSVTKKDVEGGASYLSIMQGNAEVIKKALGVK